MWAIAELIIIIATKCPSLQFVDTPISRGLRRAKGQTDPDVVHVNTGKRESAKLLIASAREEISCRRSLNSGIVKQSTVLAGPCAYLAPGPHPPIIPLSTGPYSPLPCCASWVSLAYLGGFQSLQKEYLTHRAQLNTPDLITQACDTGLGEHSPQLPQSGPKRTEPLYDLFTLYGSHFLDPYSPLYIPIGGSLAMSVCRRRKHLTGVEVLQTLP
ncbi:unnamed protein product [Lota lota]